MITTFRHLGFKRKHILHEPATVVLREVEKKGYAYISAASYVPLPLPKRFRSLRTKTTPVIRIQGKTLDDIKAGFTASARNQVNKSETLTALKIVCGNSKREVEESFKLCNQLEMAQGRPPFPWKKFASLSVCNAYYEGKLISTIAFVESVPVVRVFQFASMRMSDTLDKDRYKLIGVAGKRLVYELCRYGLAHGYEVVDLAYINLEDEHKKGVGDYKMQFGSEIVSEYRYEYKSFIYRLFERFSFLSRQCRSFVYTIISRS